MKIKGKTIISVFLAVQLMFSMITPAYAYKSYLVYAGQGDDADAEAFQAKLATKSTTWTSNTLKSNNTGANPHHIIMI